jgi:glycosyltransferase involved in cell wall biosynthesis
MKYSIITVNYNNKDGLKKTIESVIHQSYRDFEYIIIDGGSTDGSAELLKEYSDKITYWVSEPDKGIYNGMNKGIVKATGDYLNFMNSGDCFYADDVLQHVADYNYNADFIVGRDYHYSECLQQGHASIQPPRTTMMHFFMATLDHQSSFIRRELFNGSPYDESHRLVSDWIFYVEKIVGENRQVQFIPDIICRREEGGLSEQQRERNRSETDAYLHQLLAPGIYADYATLSQLDKTSLYRLFSILDDSKKRRWLVRCIKLINKVLK